MNINRLTAVALAISTGLLLALSWPMRGFPFLLLIAFIPLFIVEEIAYRNHWPRIRVFVLAYVAFFIWNALTTYWITNSTLFGGIMAS